jgi:hypothetical protein
MLPFGISAAVQQFAADTVAAIGSHEGLVALDFHRTLEAKTLTAAAASGEAPRSEQAVLGIGHLVLSLEDPEDFVSALNGRMAEARTLPTPAG